MLHYVIRRVLLAIPTLWAVATLVFISLRILPGDPARRIAGEAAGEAELESIREMLGLRSGLWDQYVTFLLGLFRGDLGTSYIYRTPVMEEIMSRLPHTMILAGLAALLGGVIGVLMGSLAARKPGTWLDTAVSTAAIAGLSMPVFWAGLLLIILFSVTLRWLPSNGVGTPLHYILPAITMSLPPIGMVARVTRAALLETMNKDFVRTAVAKGAGPQRVLVHHTLRNALMSVVTIIGLQFGMLLGGAVMVESVFSIPGIGRLIVDSIMTRDYPVVQGAILTFAFLYIVVNLLTDILYGFINPKVSYE